MSNETFDEIAASAQAQIQSLQAAENSINAQIDALRAKDPESPFSLAEKKQLDDLRDAKDTVLDAIETVALITVDKLDNTNEVRDLAAKIRNARSDLKDIFERINRIGNLAETATNILDGASKLEANLESLVG